MLWRRSSVLLLLALVASRADAAPPPVDTTALVLPPGLEDEARALLTPVLDETPESLAWRGPKVEIDRIVWWLMQGDEARAQLILAPRQLATPGEPVSHSFVIRVAWPSDAEPDATQRELTQAAVGAVQARDMGGFYLSPDVTPSARPELTPVPVVNPLLHEPPDEAATTLRRRWALELSAVAGLGLLGLFVTLRD